MIENLRRIYRRAVKPVLNQQALTGAETPLHRRLFLFLQLKQILTGLLTVISSLHGRVTSHPRVATRAPAVTWMGSDNDCTRLSLYLSQLWYLVCDENVLSLSFLPVLPVAFPQWLEWSWIWRRGWTNLRSWPAMCPTVGRAHTRYETHRRLLIASWILFTGWNVKKFSLISQSSLQCGPSRSCEMDCEVNTDVRIIILEPQSCFSESMWCAASHFLAHGVIIRWSEGSWSGAKLSLSLLMW